MDAPLWVFGYGSLIWDPGFSHIRAEVARLQGWHRSFCMASIHYRGTVEAPGLVLALDEASEGFCDGLAFAVTPGREAETLAALRERELISYAYREEWLEVDLASGERVLALCYVINRDQGQYRGALSLDEQARIIAASCGARGLNCDYLYATAEHLGKLGIADADLQWLSGRVREMRETGTN